MILCSALRCAWDVGAETEILVLLANKSMGEKSTEVWRAVFDDLTQPAMANAP